MLGDQDQDVFQVSYHLDIFSGVSPSFNSAATAKQLTFQALSVPQKYLYLYLYSKTKESLALLCMELLLLIFSPCSVV